MKRAEAFAVVTLVYNLIQAERFVGTGARDSATDEFYAAVIDKPEELVTGAAPTTDYNDEWNYRYCPHPEAKLPQSVHRGRGYYGLFRTGAPSVIMVSTNYESQAQMICAALNRHKGCEKLLRTILKEITDALEAPLLPVGPKPFGLDYRSLQHMIREALK